MPTTKTISHIGNTKFELVKDTYDAFRFTVDDKSSDPNSPKTVMYISSEPTTFDSPTPLSTSGRVTMSNIRTEGATSTSSADVDSDIGIGGKILIREGTGEGTATRAAIYAQKDTEGVNHRLIIDPYQADDGTGAASDNNGTVYIRGSLIVEGNKTILDTAEHITSENLLGINAVRGTDANGDPIITGGASTTAGIHVYSGTLVPTQFLYDFDASRWLTGATDQTLNDLKAKKLYATDLEVTGTSTLTTVDINGGNIDGTTIGATTAAAATFTSLDATGTSTLTTVDINGGNIDGTTIGATTAAAATFTSLEATGTSTLTTVDINGGNIDGTTIGATTAAAATFTSLDATGTSTLTTVDINGGNIDGTTIGANIAAAASFTTITASTNVTARDVNAVTFGNIVPVDLVVGASARELVQTITATTSSVPLHDDILTYFSAKTFAAGKCVVALTNGTQASVAMFSFSVCASVLTMVLDQEVHSSSTVLNVDYDSSGTIDLNLGTATSAVYCVKVLPVMTSDSITEQF